MFVLSDVVSREGARYYLVISKHEREHNHRVGKQEFDQIPKNRMCLDSDELAEVDLLRKVGVSRGKNLKFIWDNTEAEPCMIDVHNLLAKLKLSENGDSSLSDRLSETLDQICEDEPYGVAHVDIDRSGDKHIARCIIIQTSHMRSLFSCFPEVILVDATHGTNAEHYKLFSFMVHDSFGHGQHVQHALLTDERTETLRHAIKQFKSCNPAWPQIRCVIVDKDFTEIGVFKSELPEARILLCQFHAVKYLQDRVSRTEYGLNAVQRDRLKPVMSLIVKAKSQQAYDECYTFVRKELGVDGLSEDDDLPPFWVYFLENCHKCREMWCSYLRDNAVHLGNSTNNRLESSWQKIKTLVDRNVDIDETVTTLIWWAKVKQKDFTTAMTRVGQVFDPVHHTSAELRRISQMFSKYAFDIVKQQYDVAVSPNLLYVVCQEGTNIYSVASAATTCRVDVSLWISNSMIGTTQKLPCRHFMYLRKIMRCQTLVPCGFLNDRWQYNSAAMLERFIQRDFDVSGYSEGIYEHQTRKRTVSQTEKYRVALTESKRIAEVISRYSPPQFQTAQLVVERFADLLSEGKLDDLERAITRLSAYTEINATNGEDKPQSPVEEETKNPTEQLEDDVSVVQTTGGFAHYELDDDSNTLDIPPKKSNENGENENDNDNGEGDVDRGETQVALEEEESQAEDTNQILNPQPVDIIVIDDDSCSLALGGCDEDAEDMTSPLTLLRCILT
ncbi:hypothetical protein PF004_g6550 [Phytophthora fragariae]|uniref:ZSWIM1/3 RNaseH-like domain-containing protein n=1 Tax=Phytophthora fragariae TaxID=53985 RepID=A0A6G0PC88_9STRA|nr:hypothetical protein PF004_g6550 [Phytophthora fragariae]